MKRIIALVVGTRPEVIKLAPVCRALQALPDITAQWISTGQHGKMLEQAQRVFGLTDGIDLHLMRPDQTPLDVVRSVCEALQAQWQLERPDMVVVQGDTATAFAAALVAFYLRIPVAHVEAGLRSHRMDEPFPEEAHRRMIAPLVNLHFAPTKRSADNLLRENIAPESVFTVGNTVVDALQSIAAKEEFQLPHDEGEGKRIVMVTAHRRENHGERLEHICEAVRDIHDAVDDAVFLFPVHLNPNVEKTAFHELLGLKRVYLMPPLDYFAFVKFMSQCTLILTDSGGVQEEAPSFRIPLLVLREQTERPEAVEAGMARLVGSDRALIAREAITLLTDQAAYDAMRKGPSPFGDGKSGERIAATIMQYLKGRPA